MIDKTFKYNIKNTNWKNILIVALIVLVVLLITNLVNVNVDRNNLQNQADRAFSSAIDMALSGLNIDYTNINEKDQNYFYSRTITNLGIAKELISFTSYEHNDNLSYTLETLSEFLTNNYSSGFIFELETQFKIYNYLRQINLNPTDENMVNKLNEFINSIE